MWISFVGPKAESDPEAELELRRPALAGLAWVLGAVGVREYGEPRIAFETILRCLITRSG